MNPEYRITEREADEAFALSLDSDRYDALSKDERNMVDVLADAGRLVDEKGRRWPITVADVYAHWQQEAREREAKRLASWQDGYIFTQTDFDTLVEENYGPTFDLVETAKALKSMTGRFPNMAEVRFAMRQQK